MRWIQRKQLSKIDDIDIIKLNIMELWLKKRAALYTLIKMVDENNGSISVSTDKVSRIFNDEDDVVRIEYASGEVELLADADFDTINEAISRYNKTYMKMME